MEKFVKVVGNIGNGAKVLKVLHFGSIDCESNGIQGNSFASGMVIYKVTIYSTGTTIEEQEKIIFRCPIEEEVNEWVNKNVLPEIKGIEENCKSYDDMLCEFSKQYLKSKQLTNMKYIVHVGLPVESRFFLDMYEAGYLGEWDLPFPLLDVAGNLDQMGMNPLSVDDYNRDHGITVPFTTGGTHNPLYDAMAAALCYFDLKNYFQESEKTE